MKKSGVPEWGIFLLIIIPIFLILILIAIVLMGLIFAPQDLLDLPFSQEAVETTTADLTEETEDDKEASNEIDDADQHSDSVTVMVYMNGSNLESIGGAATQDLMEMVAANHASKLSIVIETIGTKKWQKLGVSGTTAQRFVLKQGGMEEVCSDLGQVDVYDSEPLKDFISYCADSYPADRYILVMWDHGGGPVYGFGSNDWSNKPGELSLPEIKTALQNSGVHFDIIGFDACLMGALETACALSDYGDVLVASEDFESQYGWNYMNWIRYLSLDTSLSSEQIGAMIAQDFVIDSEQANEDGIMAVIDLSKVDALKEAWESFAYANKEELLKTNYSFLVTASNRIHNENTLEDYCAVDLQAIAAAIDGDESERLENALDDALLYVKATKNETYLTGLSVTLPYNNWELYSRMEDLYPFMGFDSSYIYFLREFAADSSGSNQADWSDVDWESLAVDLQNSDLFDPDKWGEWIEQQSIEVNEEQFSNQMDDAYQHADDALNQAGEAISGFLDWLDSL